MSVVTSVAPLSSGLCGAVRLISASLVKSGVLCPDFAHETYFLAAFHHSSEALPLNEHDLVNRSFEVNTLALHNFLDAIIGEAPRSQASAASSHISESLLWGHLKTKEQRLIHPACMGFQKPQACNFVAITATGTMCFRALGYPL